MIATTTTQPSLGELEGERDELEEKLNHGCDLIYALEKEQGEAPAEYYQTWEEYNEAYKAVCERIKTLQASPQEAPVTPEPKPIKKVSRFNVNNFTH